MSTLILIPVLTAFAILALVAAVYNLRYRNATINDRLQRMVNADEALVTGEAAKLDDSIFDSTVPGWLQPLAALGFLLPTQMVSETLKWELAQAGYRHLEARRIFVGIRVLCTVTFALASFASANSVSFAARQAWPSRSICPRSSLPPGLICCAAK